jgi:segregation and condensation protein A
VLELYREATVDLLQPEPFGELTVRWTPRDSHQPDLTGAPDDTDD